jgi:tetratricopeptide (TPR) repeat protein
MLLLAAASSIVTVIAQQRGGAVSDLQGLAFGLRLENALVSYVAYLRDMLWPSALTVIYGFSDAIPAAQVALAVLVLAAISFVVFRLARRCPYLPVGWLWYLGTLVPVAGIVQVGLQARADRYTYVPLIGIFIMVAWGMPDLLARWRTVRRAVPLVAALVVVASAVATRAQVAYWKDDVALWTHATMVTMNTDEYHAHMSLGATLGNQGRLDEAVRHFSAAVRLRAGSVEAQSNLGLALAKQGKLREAIGPFAEAVRLSPDQEVTHLNLGFALSKAGRVDEAVRELSEVLRIDPGNEAARRALEDLRK